MTITISEPLKSWVEQQAAVNGFASATEYVQHVLQREREDQSARLRDGIERKVLEALDSGEAVEATPEFWKTRREELRKRLEPKGQAENA